MSISAFLQGKDFFVCDPEASRRFVCQVVHPRFYFDFPGPHSRAVRKNAQPLRPRLRFDLDCGNALFGHLPGIEPMKSRNGFPFAFQPESVV